MWLRAGEISISRYTLVSAGPLNAKSQRCLSEGVLLEHHGGYANLHPWPELGDAPLDAQLRCLVSNQKTPLLETAFRCLQLDREARTENRSLFEALTIPLSHATVVPASLDGLITARDLGFTKAKIKASGDALEHLRPILEETTIPLRIDFNGTSSPDRLINFFGELPASALKQVDFLEDPFPYHPETWLKLREAVGCRLALDRYHQPLASQQGFDFLVLKPAAQPDVIERVEWAVDRGLRVVVTSYMDHPIGQVYAAYVAAQIQRRWPGSLDLCGLVTHRLFKMDLFSEQLGSGPRLNVPGGSGLGFDDLLGRLTWEKL